MIIPEPEWFAEWERCRGWIEPALDAAGNTHTIEDVLQAVLRGDAHFWPGKRAAAVTEITQYPRARAMNIWLAGGNLREIVRIERSIEQWAKALGCDRVTCAGRPGWGRFAGEHSELLVFTKRI